MQFVGCNQKGLNVFCKINPTKVTQRGNSGFLHGEKFFSPTPYFPSLFPSFPLSGNKRLTSFFFLTYSISLRSAWCCSWRDTYVISEWTIHSSFGFHECDFVTNLAIPKMLYGHELKWIFNYKFFTKISGQLFPTR